MPGLAGTRALTPALAGAGVARWVGPMVRGGRGQGRATAARPACRYDPVGPLTPDLATMTATTRRSLQFLTALLPALVTSMASAQPNADLATWTCVGTCGSSGADGDITESPLGSGHAFLSTNGSTATGVSHLDIEESGGGGQRFRQTNGSRYTSAAFSLGSGQAVEAWFNYISTDGKGFDDHAWARLVDTATGTTAAWMFTARSTNGSKQNVVPGNALAKATNETVGFNPVDVLVNYADFDFNTRNTAIGNPVDWSRLGEWNGTCWRDNAEGCGFSGWLHAVVTPGAGTYRLEVGVVNFGDTLWDSGIAFDMAGLNAAPVPEPATAALLAGGLALLARRRRQAGVRG